MPTYQIVLMHGVTHVILSCYNRQGNTRRWVLGGASTKKRKEYFLPTCFKTWGHAFHVWKADSKQTAIYPHQ